jgi:glutathione S-transferase
VITLYAFGRVHPLVHGLTRDLRAQWALEEVELPYHVRGLDHTGGELSQPEFHQLNPFEQLPVLDDDGFVLTESGAILGYLAEKAGRLMPTDARGKATVSRWCFAALTSVEPAIQAIALQDLQKQRDGRDDLVKTAERMLTAFEEWLDTHPYAAGAEFTVADILMTTVLRLARHVHLLDHHPRCEAYRQRCEARPAWQRTVKLYEARLGSEPGAVARAAEPS